ncbi:MAG: anti-sigma factor, partial [Chloroflexota bacterium]
VFTGYDWDYLSNGGTFTVDANGRGQMLVRAPLPITSYQSMGVTVEPMGGSPGPTGARMLRGPSQNNP